MKKLLWIGALSALLLAACGDEEVESKENTSVVETAEENENPIDQAVKSVTKKDYEIKQNEGIVSITINDDTLHEGSKRAILKDSAELFAELSKVEGVTAPSITWTSTLTDQHGNQSNGEILSISIDGDTFAKVDWDNYRDLDIEALAYGYKQHESLKD